MEISKSGFIYVWDLRGGRPSTAFQSHKEVHSSPITSVKLASLLNRIEPLNVQLNIQPKEIQSIDINSFHRSQLGFHLDDGWSGVLDMHNLIVTHIHCLHLLGWLKEILFFLYLPQENHHGYLNTRYMQLGHLQAMGFTFWIFIHTPAPHAIDSEESFRPHKQNRLIPLSGRVTACATHPLSGTIVAGTLNHWQTEADVN